MEALYVIGDDFESYLDDNDIFTMNSVSQTTRGGIIATKFRELYSYILSEYKLCKQNENNSYSLNDFMYSYPIRTILRDYNYDADILIRVTNHMYSSRKIDHYTAILIKTEVSDKYDNAYKLMVNDAIECCNRRTIVLEEGSELDQYEVDNMDLGFDTVSDLDYDPRTIILRYMEDMSIRWNARLVHYLYNVKYEQGETFTYMDAERDYFYSVKKELRDVYLKYEPNNLGPLGDFGITLLDDFGVAHTDWDRAELFTHTLEYAVKYGDWEEFKQYMGDKLETYRKYLVNAYTYEELFKRPKYQTIDGYRELLPYYAVDE